MPSLHSKDFVSGSVLGKVAITAGLLFAGVKLARSKSRKKVNLNGKVVLISGGSRGLGLALAEELGSRGSHIALCARDSAELDRAAGKLARSGVEAAAFPCDVTRQSDLEPLVGRVIERFGRIDILINDAGKIQVGPVEKFDHSDFDDAMNLMFWAPVNLTFAVLPHMRKQGSGYIVNITSVGGRVSVPHLLPYSCAKFAAVGFSTGLSTELPREGIHVLTVVPGLMRTGSYLNAKFTGEAKHEFAWFGLLGNLPGFSVAATYAAEQVRKAIENQRYTCTISLPAKLLIAAEALLPEMTRSIMDFAVRHVLPGSGGTDHLISGKSLNADLNQVFQLFTIFGKRAAEQFNQ